jgi:hypothetical protein
MRIRLTAYGHKTLTERRKEIAWEYVARVVANPYRSEVQPDGRRRLWGYIEEERKWLRVIVLPDGAVHNAFFDRRFKP